MKRRKVPRKELPATRAGLSQRWRSSGWCKLPLPPAAPGRRGGGTGNRRALGDCQGRVEIRGGMGRMGNGREAMFPHSQRGGDYLVTGARRHCRSGEPRCVSKSWSLLLRVWGRTEGARRCWLSEPHSARAPLVSFSRLPPDPTIPPPLCSNPRGSWFAGSKSGSGGAPAEWGFGGLNSFFSFCRCWCSPDNRAAGHRFGACLPFGARGKSQSQPGGCSGR